jgi:hypothetical protein
MTKIIPIRQSDIRKIVKMIEYISSGISPDITGDTNFIHFPVNFFHSALPLHWKFLQESYVAVEKNEPLGLISLVPDGNTRTRWKINRLVLGIEAYDVGKQLIDYVVNKYGGAGVERFLTTIDENSPEAIALFKKECFFRQFSKINIWEHESSAPAAIMPEALRGAVPADASKLFELDKDAILPHLRSSLVKTTDDFRFDLARKLSDTFKGYKACRYVLDNAGNNTLEGFLSMTTADSKHFWVDITLSLAYMQYYEELLGFTLGKIKSSIPDAKIYIGVKDYHQASTHMTDVLTSHKFKQCGNFQILVKDYWKPIREYKENTVPAIIFPDMTSPACNITRFISES